MPDIENCCLITFLLALYHYYVNLDFCNRLVWNLCNIIAGPIFASCKNTIVNYAASINLSPRLYSYIELTYEAAPKDCWEREAESARI